MKWFAFALVMLVAPLHSFAQEAPTGAHYAGRHSDTGFGGTQVNATGAFPAAVPLDLPAARGGLPVPLQIVYGGRGFGAAGLGWDIPLSYVQRDRTLAHRRPKNRLDITPVPRERVRLSLLGQHYDLLPHGNAWVAREGTLELTVRQDGDAWLVYDGQGRTYTFTPPDSLVGNGLWLLKTVSGAGEATLELTYETNILALEGGSAFEINLIRIAYNKHPTSWCMKHEVMLTYHPSAPTPVSASVLGDKILTRQSAVRRVEVMSRAACGAERERLRGYVFLYTPDADTTLPRLQAVRALGRQGTPEMDRTLPVASYGYGAATKDGKLHYERTQTVAIPTGAELWNISGTVENSTVTSPVPGTRYAMAQSLTDVNGDGRADLVFRKNSKLWVARNRPAPGGKTLLVGQPSVSLSDATFNGGAYSTHSSTKRRFSYASTNFAANRNTVNVWRQAIDVNGDGRLDIVDAAEKAGRWVVYLNTPGGTSGVKWVRRDFQIGKLRQELIDRGHKLESNHLPLSRRATGTNVNTWVCWKWDGVKYVWWKEGWNNHRCEGTDGRILSRGPELTYVEWEFTDLNGDGYPDFVFNSSPTGFQLRRPDTTLGPLSQVVDGAHDVPFKPEEANAVRAAFNRSGLLFGTNDYPFTKSVSLAAQSPELGVGYWASREMPSGHHDGQWYDRPTAEQTMPAGFADVNGDGLADRVVERDAYLGTYAGAYRSRDVTPSFSRIHLKLPGPLATVHSGQKAQCRRSSDKFTTRQHQGLRDLTGDGIPDYYDRGKVWIGVGAGFPRHVGVNHLNGFAFTFSHQTESCDGKKSHTDGGLYDIDGDGKPEVVGLANSTFLVSQLVGGSAWGVPEAGRLTQVANGYGALTRISYLSAKEKAPLGHQVPFPEIVVGAVETAGLHNLGGDLAGARYAYGNAQLVYDQALDRFVFPGYQRFVELRLFGPKPLGAATVFDAWPLTPFQPGLAKKDRWLRARRVGRPRDIFTLRGSEKTDPWAFLDVDANDALMVGATHYEWDAKLYEASGPDTASIDCLDMIYPLDFQKSLVNSTGGVNPCHSHGFVFGRERQSWYGARPPPGDNNVQTRSRALEVDDYGRVTLAHYEGDLFKSDDDVCVENRYAVPAGDAPRVLTALFSRRVMRCDRSATLAGETFEYDNLTPGRVALGHMTSHVVERRATDTGALIKRVRRFDAAYDAAGNLAHVSTRRDVAQRKVSFEYDQFGLAPTRAKIDASGIPSTESFVNYDPVSLRPLTSTDANQTRRGSEFDGFGRLRRTTVTPPGGTVAVTSTVAYMGFTDPDPAGRRVVFTEFPYTAEPALVATAPGRTATVFLDELSRERRTEVDLGADYRHETLVIGSRTYDGLGRASFEADPYPKSQPPETAYGTTYHFQLTGDLRCAIRGRGPQPFSMVTDAAAERFPTCFQLSYGGHVVTLDVSDAASLQAGSQQQGVVRRTVSSATGRVLERSTVKATGARLDHASFSYDRLGQRVSMTRYLDPVTAARPVDWSLQLDSTGRTLSLSEPSTATLTYAYSNWGEQVETRWNDGADRRLVNTYDALGRLTSAVEVNNGVPDADTLKQYAYDTAVSVSPEVTPTYVLGRLARASSKTGQVAFGYDAFGRVNAQTFTDNRGGRYVEKSLYNYDGSLAALEFRLPDRSYEPEAVNYSYDSAGRLRAMNEGDSSGSRELYRAEHIDALGRLRSARYRGNTTYKADYAEQGRRLLKRSEVRSPLGHREASFLAYDAMGRELFRREVRDGVAGETKTGAAYDALGRLAVAIQTNGATTLSAWRYSYDALGNVARLEDMLGAADASLSYTAADPDRVCRVAYGNRVTAGPVCNVGHDALGNIVSQPTRTGQRQLTYYSSGAVRTINEQGTQARFAYDAFGQVQELDVQGGPTLDKRRDRRYGALIEHREVTSRDTTSLMIVRNIPGPSGIAISRRGRGDEWVFGFGELRGNRHFTDQNGAFVQGVDYSPFGEAVSNGLPAGAANYTNYQWNGGDSLAAFGLSHLGARVYDPVIGRFLSRDPLLVARGATTTNPYAFAMNDPLNAADPSGLDCIEGTGCNRSLPVILPWSWWGSRGGGGSQQAPEQTAPPISSGPQTRTGRDIKRLGEILNIGSFGNNFDFDSLARNTDDFEEAINILVQTREASDAIAAHNARLNAVGSLSAGFGDALLCKNFDFCAGQQIRAGLGITSGDANKSLYKAGHVAGITVPRISPDPESAASAISSLGEGIISEVYPEGSFSIFDWSDYPLPEVLRPKGPFWLLGDDEYYEARKAADRANRKIRRLYGYVGLDIDVHEIHPVRFGGDPTAWSNKVVMPREWHRRDVSPWWYSLQRDLERKR